jgi:hypothetical protein
VGSRSGSGTTLAGSPAEALRAENAALQQRVAQLQGLLNQRAVPVLATLVDALNAMAGAAQAGDPGARQLLGEWRQALQNADSAASGLVVVNGRLPTH